MRYDWFNQNLFDIIPASARRILDIGCDTGLLGKKLKEQDPGRTVVGIEIDAEAGALAKTVLDQAYVLNIETDNLDHIDGDFDAIILGDVIEHLFDPLVALQKIRRLLADDGRLYTSIPNIQHYSIFRRLLKGDFQYRDTGLLDSTHVRFYCLANIDKLLLDAGYLPQLQSRIVKKDDGLANHLGHMISRLGIGESVLRNMEAFQFQHIAGKIGDCQNTDRTPLSFIVHSQYTGVLKDNFYASPVVRSGHPHQIMIFQRPSKLPDAWNQGMQKAVNDYLVLVREHVYLPNGWDVRLVAMIRQIEASAGSNWIAGCSGVSKSDTAPQGLDYRGALLTPGQRQMPLTGSVDEVESLADAVIVMPRETAQSIDVSLGDHLHGLDLAMRTKQHGGRVFALGLPCLENGPYTNRVPPGFDQSEAAVKTKWQSALPLASPTGVIR